MDEIEQQLAEAREQVRRIIPEVALDPNMAEFWNTIRLRELRAVMREMRDKPEYSGYTLEQVCAAIRRQYESATS